MSKKGFPVPCHLTSRFSWSHFVFQTQQLLIAQSKACPLLVSETARGRTQSQFSVVQIRWAIQLWMSISKLREMTQKRSVILWVLGIKGLFQGTHWFFSLDLKKWGAQKESWVWAARCSGWRRSHWLRWVFAGEFKIVYNVLQGSSPERYLEASCSFLSSTFACPAVSSNPLPWSFQGDSFRMPQSCSMLPQVSLSRGWIAVLHIYVNQVQSSGKLVTPWPCQIATSLTRFIFQHSFPHPVHLNWKTQLKFCGKVMPFPDLDMRVLFN